MINQKNNKNQFGSTEFDVFKGTRISNKEVQEAQKKAAFEKTWIGSRKRSRALIKEKQEYLKKWRML